MKHEELTETVGEKESNLLFVIKISGITALCGLLFGYDTAVSSRFGRKKVLIGTALFFALSVLTQLCFFFCYGS